MKKISVIFGMAILFLYACSSGDDLLTSLPVEEEPDFTVEDVTSDVPIVFGGISDGRARAEITRGSIDFSSFNMNDVGLFCLSTHKLPGATESLTWTDNPQTVDVKKTSLNGWLFNAPATICEAAGNTGNLIIDNSVPNHYYPNKNWYAYDFAAYHPRTEHIVRTYDRVTAYVTVDGNDDVMYATAGDPPSGADDKAYSYKYYKDLNSITMENLPHLSFTRLSSRLNFKFYFVDNAVEMANAEGRHFRVDSVTFDDFPCIFKFDVAKRENDKLVVSIPERPFVLNDDDRPVKAKEGGGTEPLFPDLGSAFGHFWLREKNDESIRDQKDSNGRYKYQLDNATAQNPLEVGDCIFIPPVHNHSRTTINLYVYLKDQDNNSYCNVNPILVAPPTNAGWEINTEYTVEVQLKNPVLMYSRGSLDADWNVHATVIHASESE